MLKIEEIQIIDSGSISGVIVNPRKKTYSKLKSNTLKIYSITEIKKTGVDTTKTTISNKAS